jgi:hypothetical protein
MENDDKPLEFGGTILDPYFHCDELLPRATKEDLPV